MYPRIPWELVRGSLGIRGPYFGNRWSKECLSQNVFKAKLTAVEFRKTVQCEYCTQIPDGQPILSGRPGYQ